MTVQDCTVQNNPATGYNRLGNQDLVDFYLTGYARSVSGDMLIKGTATKRDDR